MGERSQENVRDLSAEHGKYIYVQSYEEGKQD